MSQLPYHRQDLAGDLIQAAEDELEAKGSEGFSLRSVAKRAQVSHAAPAHHFGDRSGLLTALAARGYERLIEFQARRRADAAKEQGEQSIASGLGYIDFATAHPALFRLMFSSELPDRSNPRFAAASRQAFDQLTEEIEQRTGKNPYTDPQSMAELLASWGMVHGLAELINSGRAEQPMDAAGLAGVERDEVLIRSLRKLL